MPQLMPSVEKIPQARATKLTAPAQPAQGDGPTFRSALDEVKKRAARKADDADKRPAKAESKKQTRPTKAANRSGAAGKPNAKSARIKDPAGAPEDEGHSDAAADQSGQEEPERQKQGTEDKTSAEADKAAAMPPAAMVQLQASQNAASPVNASAENKEVTEGTSATAKRSGGTSIVPKAPDGAKTKDKSANSPGAAANEANVAGQADTSRATTSANPGVPADATNGQAPVQKPPLLGAKKGQQQAASSDPGQSTAGLAPLTGDAQAVADSLDSSDDPQPATDSDSAAKPSATLSLDDVMTRSMPQSDSLGTTPTNGSPRAGTPQPAIPAAPPEVQFTEANHAKIVGAIQGQLLPNGGSMHIRLDPPELGALNVRVEMRDGVMTAAFETTNDQATKVLSHSLGELKTALEAQGVSVEKLHVRQSAQQQSSSGDERKGERHQDSAAQREQQRREMMRRIWRKMMKGQDPLDLVA